MEKREKLIRVICCHEACKKPFHLRVETQQANVDGTAEVAVDCPYCGDAVMVTLEKEYLEPEVHVREVQVRTVKGDMPR